MSEEFNQTTSFGYIHATRFDHRQEVDHFLQGIIDPTETKTRQIFSRMFVIAKTFKELFNPN